VLVSLALPVLVFSILAAGFSESSTTTNDPGQDGTESPTTEVIGSCLNADGGAVPCSDANVAWTVTWETADPQSCLTRGETAFEAWDGRVFCAAPQ